MVERKKSDAARTIGMIVHTELASTDPEATKSFLEEVFGWNFETLTTPTGKQIAFRTQGGTSGSIRAAQRAESPVSMSYVLVDDIDGAASKIKKMGGEIVLPRTDVPGMGSFLWFKVPGGPVLACWQDAAKRRQKAYA